jgi:pimeloyl-ACP methyl ester carboxylesterase
VNSDLQGNVTQCKSVRAADGSVLYFATIGDGAKPALFLGPHFYLTRPTDDPYDTDDWISLFRRDFYLILADSPRGAGGRGNPPGLANTPDLVVEDFIRIADAAGVGQFGWLGYSYGAAIGVQLACRSNRISALAVGGFPPINAPFRFMVDITTRAATTPPPDFATLDPDIIRSITGFYRPLLDWPERREVSKLGMPRLSFMGELDGKDSGNDPWTPPLAEHLRAVERDLRELGWQVTWLPGHDHLSTVRSGVSAAIVHRFFSHALCETCP